LPRETNVRDTLRAGTFLLCALLAGASWAQTRKPLVQSLDLQVPLAPIPVTIGGNEHLAYELHVTNFRNVDVVLTHLEVLDADRGAVIADLRGATLAARLVRPGIRASMPDKRLIAPGMRAVVNFWLPVDTVPRQLQHRLEFDFLRTEGRERGVVQDTGLAVRTDSPAALDPPLRGGPWVGLYDPSMERGHRTSIYVLDGRARIPARFAIDWVRLDENSKPSRGDGKQLENWHGYGAEVLAVADGVIAAASDDLHDSLLSGATGPMPLENDSGNYVTLDLGDGRYAFYEHLKRGTIRVKAGDRVKSGDVIGLLGNSGSSSSGPHLHFHVADANATLAAEGLPYVFKRFTVVGAFESIGAYASGQRWKSVAREVGGERKMELPAPNVVVMFEER
jgi:murein DD-endopeptidase